MSAPKGRTYDRKPPSRTSEKTACQSGPSTYDSRKTSEKKGFHEVDGALCRTGARRAAAAPKMSTVNPVQIVDNQAG
jgi:hypothetical protein